MAILKEVIDGNLIEVDIQSSNLKKAKYDTQNKTLLITFNNNTIYEYANVPWEIFTRMRLSESQGKFFSTEISRKYNYKKIS